MVWKKGKKVNCVGGKELTRNGKVWESFSFKYIYTFMFMIICEKIKSIVQILYSNCKIKSCRIGAG